VTQPERLSQLVEIVDLSANNGIVRAEAIASSGVIGAMVKLTEGVNYEDPLAAGHCAGVRTVGMLLGGYHYLRVRHDRDQDATLQAQQYLNVWRREQCRVWPSFDVELAFNQGCTAAEWACAVLDFTREVRRQIGAPPMTYTDRGEWIAAGGLEALTELSDCPLWLAAIGAPPVPPRPFQKVSLHQFTWTAQIPGIDTDVDGSRALVPIADLLVR